VVCRKLSFRKKEGFIITGSSKDMAKINIEGITFVKRCDSKKKKYTFKA
jgi:hypothetical protein